MTSQQNPTIPTAHDGEVPLWAPLYGASPVQAVVRFFRKYADFSGRASRSEYWWWVLASIVISAVLEIPTLTIPGAGVTWSGPGAGSIGLAFWLSGVISLALIVPSLAVTWRRLHDANFAGPFFFLGFIPFVGTIIVLVLMLLPSKPEGARFDRPRG